MKRKKEGYRRARSERKGDIMGVEKQEDTEKKERTTPRSVSSYPAEVH